MKISALTDILIVEDKTGTKPKPDGTLSKWKVVRAVVYEVDGKQVAALGVLRVPKQLEATAAVGRFTGTYELTTADWGDSKGEIGFSLVGLTPYAQASTAPSKAASAV